MSHDAARDSPTVQATLNSGQPCTEPVNRCGVHTANHAGIVMNYEAQFIRLTAG